MPLNLAYPCWHKFRCILTCERILMREFRLWWRVPIASIPNAI
ncbi:Uncharacterised protein [Vibrio cholerae]|nr:Uncharacterised protein [Vibrio cholerae]